MKLETYTITTVLNYSDKPKDMVIRLAEQTAWSKRFMDSQAEIESLKRSLALSRIALASLWFAFCLLLTVGTFVYLTARAELLHLRDRHTASEPSRG